MQVQARSHGLLVKAEDLQLRGCGFESRFRIFSFPQINCRCQGCCELKNVEKQRPNQTKARSHGLVAKADDSCSRGCEFEPQHSILVGCKRCQLLHINNENNENKGSQRAHQKKDLTKLDLTNFCLSSSNPVVLKVGVATIFLTFFLSF